MSRTRLIRPAFFTDERMAALPIPTRYVYIGLWTLCDDAGYFERRPAEIAVALLPYEGPRRRQRLVDAALEQLAGAGRIQWLECGDHGFIRTLPEHGFAGGNHSFTSRDKHRSECGLRLFSKRETESVRTGTDKSVVVVGVGVGVGVGVESGRAAAREKSILDEEADRAGGWAANHAANRKAVPA